MNSKSTDRDFITSRCDKYFSKSRAVVDREDALNGSNTKARAGIFMRHDVICAIQPAIDFIESCNYAGIKVKRLYEEGALVPSEKVIFEISGNLYETLELETLILQRVGASCLSAYNAFKMCRSLPKAAFIDMHARHACGDDMTLACAYGASVGSQAARRLGAKGFIGSSQDITAPFYGSEKGIGTMPHALVGYFGGDVLKATLSYVATHPNDRSIVALTDYRGQEISDLLAVADWFYDTKQDAKGKTLSVRLDTHGGRFAEGLDYDKSVRIVSDWLHVDGKWPTVRQVMGDDAYDVADDAIRDGVAKILFGTGVSAANIINTRQRLNGKGYDRVQIVASSGFNPRKCKIMANARAPIDVVGTGSFIPDKWSECCATMDYFDFNGEFSVKVGRESIFKDL
jgi:nicotinate phosphoribosyltransferase